MATVERCRLLVAGKDKPEVDVVIPTGDSTADMAGVGAGEPLDDSSDRGDPLAQARQLAFAEPAAKAGDRINGDRKDAGGVDRVAGEQAIGHAKRQSLPKRVAPQIGEAFVHKVGADPKGPATRESVNVLDPYQQFLKTESLKQRTEVDEFRKSQGAPISREGNAFIDAAIKHILKPDIPGTVKELTTLMTNVAAFEARLRNSGKSLDEAKTIYSSLTELLTKPGVGWRSDRQRARLVEQLMHNVTEPLVADQNISETCAIDSYGKILLARSPSMYVDLVKQAVLNGEYKAIDGTIVKLEKKDLEFHGEEAQNTKPGEGLRKSTAKIFAIVATNLYYDHKHKESSLSGVPNPYGQLQYRYRDGHSMTMPKTGADPSKFPPEITKELGSSYPIGVGTIDGVVEVHRLLTGKHDPDIVIAPMSAITPSTRYGQRFRTEQELETILKSRQDYPVMLFVHGNSPILDGERKRLTKALDNPQKSVLEDGHLLVVGGPDTDAIKFSNERRWKIFNSWNQENNFDGLYLPTLNAADVASMTRPLPAMTAIDHVLKLHKAGQRPRDEIASLMANPTTLARLKSLSAQYEAYWSRVPAGQLSPQTLKDQAESRLRFGVLIRDFSKQVQ